MCNAWNHPRSCTCGWGGDGHLGRSPGGYAGQLRSAPSRNPLRSYADKGFASHTEPNASCPVCHADVYFYQSPNGGRVFFDELGPPWPKHPCTDHAAARSSSAAVRIFTHYSVADRKPFSWESSGWRAIQIGSSVRERGKHAVNCIDLATLERFTAYATAPVTVTGAVVAAIRAWDQLGRSEISFIELDDESAPRSVVVTRAINEHNRFAVEKLEAYVAEAEKIAEGTDSGRIRRRHDELRALMGNWARHVEPATAERYWQRLTHAEERAASAQQELLAKNTGTYAALVAEMRGLPPVWLTLGVCSN